MMKRVLTVIAALAVSTAPGLAKDLDSIGISLGSLSNPYFVALSKGAEDAARKVNPNVKVTIVGFDYDLNKQFAQIDRFIADHVDMILLNPGDATALEPAIKKAEAAGILVVAVDTAAKGADLTVTTNNIQAGELACQFIVERLRGRGSVIIENGPQVSSVIDRVNGCKAALAKAPGIRLLSYDQDGRGSREGGMAVAEAYLTRFARIDAIFTTNDQQAIGTDLEAKKLNRTGFIITSVDGAPDVANALKDPNSPMIQATASQDPYQMAQLAVKLGVEDLNGKKPERDVTLLPSKLITRDNVTEATGWTSPH